MEHLFHFDGFKVTLSFLLKVPHRVCVGFNQFFAGQFSRRPTFVSCNHSNHFKIPRMAALQRRRSP
jgi:hypothetical protein